MAKTGSAKKSPTDSKRNQLVHALAFRWLEINRPDVVSACCAEGNKKYPRSEKSRSQIELTKDLLALK